MTLTSIIYTIALFLSVISTECYYLKNCSSDEASFLPLVFRNIGIGKGWLNDHSGCPNDPWVIDMAQLFMQDLGVFMNVGFNKGYNFANWANLFTPWNNITAVEWHRTALNAGILTNTEDDCGWCDDCKVKYTTKSSELPHTRKDFIFIGVDLNELNHVMVNKTLRLISESPDMSLSALSFYLILAGASSDVGVIQIPKCKFGDELCKLPDSNIKQQNTMQLPLITVESCLFSVLRQHKQGRELSFNFHHSTNTSLIDMLLIDVEGFDALVVQGAHNLLRRRAIRVLRFEYNAIGPWKNIRIEYIVLKLDSFGYDCFFEGQRRLWYISGSCWHERWEFHQWANVMCVRRNDPWIDVVKKYIVSRRGLLSQFEGKAIRRRNDKKVYLVENGTMRLFRGADAFITHGLTWGNVVPVDRGISEILLRPGIDLDSV